MNLHKTFSISSTQTDPIDGVGMGKIPNQIADVVMFGQN
jgi:hypothetical protein